MTAPRFWVATAAALALIGIATAVAGLPAPAPLRLALGLAPLVGLGGDAAVRLILGRSERLTDRVLRTSLVVVLGLVMLLATVLILAAAGLPIGPEAISPAAGIAAAVLTLAAALVRPDSVPGATGPLLTRDQLRPVSAVLAGLALTGALLGVAVTIADGLRPQTSEPSTLFEFSEQSRHSGTPAEAQPGAPVRIGVTLRSYASDLPDARPEVTATVAGDRPGRLDVSWLAVQRLGDSGATREQAQRSGTVAFAAPQRSGLYRVELSTPSPQGGSDLLLITYLDIR